MQLNRLPALVHTGNRMFWTTDRYCCSLMKPSSGENALDTYEIPLKADHFRLRCLYMAGDPVKWAASGGYAPDAKELNIACISVAQLELLGAAGHCLLLSTVCQHQIDQLAAMWNLLLSLCGCHSTAGSQSHVNAQLGYHMQRSLWNMHVEAYFLRAGKTIQRQATNTPAWGCNSTCCELLGKTLRFQGGTPLWIQQPSIVHRRFHKMHSHSREAYTYRICTGAKSFVFCREGKPGDSRESRHPL